MAGLQNVLDPPSITSKGIEQFHRLSKAALQSSSMHLQIRVRKPVFLMGPLDWSFELWLHDSCALKV